MPNKVIVLTPAREDIVHISDYHLMMVGPASTEKITDKLLDGIDHLAEHPLMGSLHGDPMLAEQGYRKLVCGEYICVYRVLGDEVTVYRVVHGATDYPKYFI